MVNMRMHKIVNTLDHRMFTKEESMVLSNSLDKRMMRKECQKIDCFETNGRTRNLQWVFGSDIVDSLLWEYEKIFEGSTNLNKKIVILTNLHRKTGYGSSMHISLL